jgi:nucleoside phosphorylase
MSTVLVVAATARELAMAPAWLSLECGVGPVEAAARTARAIAELRPTAIVHVGIAGARRVADLAATTLVIGSESRYTDLAVPSTLAPRVCTASLVLVTAAQRALPSAVVRPIGTTARVGGSVDCDVEAMEGFAVLRAAELAGIPAIEVRCISNEIEEVDRTKWHFDHAFATIIAATPALVREVAQCVR